MKKIILNARIKLDGKRYEAGQTASVKDDVADELIDKGCAALVEDKKSNSSAGQTE